MSRTLADMTPAERAACVGMWCEDQTGNLAVYVRDSLPVENGDRWGESAVVIGGGHDPASDLSRPWLSSLTPRMDLPRAWTPSGEPVPGEWEEKVYQDGIGDYIWFTRQRRYITDWEVPHVSR